MAYFADGAQLSRLEREQGKPAASTGLDTRNGLAFLHDGHLVRPPNADDIPIIERPSRKAPCSSLEDAVRQAVIPRLYAQRMKEKDLPRAPLRLEDSAQAIIAAGAVDRLLRLVQSGQANQQEAFLQELYDQAVPIRKLLEDVVVPVANEIGRAWSEDHMSFAEVTLKIGLMQTAVSNFTSKALVTQPQRHASRFLLSPVPGEHHVFGSVVLSSLLNAYGFQAEAILDANHRKLCERVEAHRYAAIGLSCNSDRTLPLVKGLVTDLRGCSRNRSIVVMVGGWALHRDNKSLHTLGADLVVTNDRDAMEAIAERFEHGN